MIIVDSLTRFGNAYGEAGAVKPFFGAGRELEEEGAGSVTVIATALWGFARRPGRDGRGPHDRERDHPPSMPRWLLAGWSRH